MAANNLGPALDQQLNELRRQIKNKSPIETIAKCIERISQAMLDLDSEKDADGQFEFLKNISNELFEFKILSTNDKQRIDNLLEKSNDESYLISRFMEIFRNNLKTFAIKNTTSESSFMINEKLCLLLSSNFLMLFRGIPSKANWPFLE